MTPPLARGVYALPFGLTLGGQLLVAIDARGCRIAEREVPAGDNPYPVLEDLWIELTALSPTKELARMAG